MHIAATDFKATARFVVHAGKESFPLANGVRASTLADLQQALVALGPADDAVRQEVAPHGA